MSKTQVKSNSSRFGKFRMESPASKFFTILLYVIMTIIVLIVLLPVLHIIAASFSEPQAVISGKVSFWPKSFTLRGYEAVFTYKKFWTGFRNSLFYMVFGTFINIVMTLLCAYPLSRKEFTARNKVAMFFVFTMYFSGGMVPSFMLVNSLGLVDTIWAMLIPGAMSTYNMIIARTYMVNSIPDELYEAAEIDGANRWQQIVNITIPSLVPMITVMLLLSVGNIMRSDTGLFYQVTRNSGQLYSTTQVIDSYVLNAIFKNSNFGFVAATTFFQSVVGLLMMLLANGAVRKIAPENALF